MTDTHDAVGTDLATIAVGIDFTPSSRLASDRASLVAKATHSRLLDVHVVPESAVVAGKDAEAGAVIPSATAEGRRALRAASALAEEQMSADVAGIEAQTLLRVGRPYEELAHAAESRGAWLLVVGVSPSIQPGETLLLGTTAELALRHGSTPVLLARENVAHTYGRVLMPVAPDDLSLRAMRMVARLAPDAVYDVVHFLPPGGSHESKSRAHRDAVVAELAGLCVDAGLEPARTRVRVFVAEAREGILGELRHRAPDLVAMGTHARSGIARVVLGSVADYVIHAAAGIDVLVVPPEK